MIRNWSSITIVLACHLTLAGSASADEAAERLVEEALPLMYHSCESVVDESGGDMEYVENVVRALTAVSLYNHEIDISSYAKSDAEKDALRDKFVAALRQECAADPDALLAGAIDDAVVIALSLND